MKPQLTETLNWLFCSLLCTMAIVFLAFALVMSVKQIWLPALIELTDYVRFF